MHVMTDKTAIYQYLEQKKFDRAEALLQTWCRRHPTDPESTYLLGQIRAKTGRLAEAETAFRRVIALQPEAAVGYGGLGTVLRTLGRFTEAAEVLQKACGLLPGDEGYRLELIDSLQKSGRRGDAFHECRRLVAEHPESGRGYFALATLCHSADQHEQAIDNYQLALKHAPDLLEAHKGLAEAYGTRGERALARQHFERVLREKPDHLAASAGLATLHERSGELDRAYETVRHVVDTGRRDATIAHVYTNICQRFDDCMRAVEYAESTLTALDASARQQRRVLHFALGRRYDRMGRYDEAFTHFREANSQLPVNYDPAAHVDFVTGIIQTFSPAYMMRAVRASNRSDQPVFIVGMPRSGTSLVEQVIGSHPEIAAGGELEDVSNMLSRIPTLLDGKTGYPWGVPDITKPQLDKLATDYLAHLHRISADASRVTDKMPHNFLALGLICQLFPGARVIHCRRDPLDTCLSIYFQSFLRQHDYAGDLEHIGTHYRQYLRLMRHWRNVLDIPVIEVEYRNMVDNLEAEARRLLAFCGLDWDPACLAFHASERIVHTASYSQVRQPIYRHSVERWRHYERHLDGLKAALERDY